MIARWIHYKRSTGPENGRIPTPSTIHHLIQDSFIHHQLPATVQKPRSKMTSYISIPIIEESVRAVEHNSRLEGAVKAMVSAILNLYFTAVNGFIIGPGQIRNGNNPGFTIFRIQRLVPGERGLVDHIVAEVKNAEVNVDGCLEELRIIWNKRISSLVGAGHSSFMEPALCSMNTTGISRTSSSLGGLRTSRGVISFARARMRQSSSGCYNSWLRTLFLLHDK